MHKSIACILASLLVSSSAMAQLCFQETEIITTLFDPDLAIVADVDQDGDMDIISTSSPTPSMQPGKSELKLAWYENDGGVVPMFTEHVFGSPEDFLTVLTIVDFNGDGYPDIFSETKGFGSHIWYENTGGPNPSFIQRYTGWGGSHPEAFADIDGDGDTDILQGGTTWSRYTGAGSTHFEQLSFSSGFNGTITGTFDPDLDGDLDLLTNAGFWYENDGGAIPQFVGHFIDALNPGDSFRPVFLDSDQYPDLITNNFRWYWNYAAAGLPTGFDVNIIDPLVLGPLTPADVDLDGDLDLIDANDIWYSNDGTWQNPDFTPQQIAPAASGPYTARDLDGDGDVDLVNPMGNSWFRNERNPQGLPVTFSLQLFNGLTPGSTPSMSDEHLHDLNNDGDLDSVLSREGVGVFSWFNNSTATNMTTNAIWGDLEAAMSAATIGDTIVGDPGVFDCAGQIILYDKPLDVISRGHLFSPRALMFDTGSLQAAPGHDVFIEYATISSPGLIGAPSPFVTARTLNVNSIMCGSFSNFTVNGNVRVAPTVLLLHRYSASISGVRQIRTADLNNDELIDAIVLKGDNKLAWFQHQPPSPGGFNEWDGIEQAVFPQTDVSDSFEVGDFNNDGLIDILAHDTGELFLFLNNGDKNGLSPFTLHTVAAGNFSGGDIAVGDLDDDGDLDIIHGGLGSKSGGATKLFTNDGNDPPSFSSTTIYGHRYYVNHINLTDMNGDGDLDVLIAQDPPLQDESGIVVLHNQGTSPATFASEQIFFYPPTIPMRVYGGDFDNDGDGDILAHYPEGESPRIVLLESNAPAPGYRRRVIAQGDNYGDNFAVADFDNDGDLDFITGATVVYKNNGENPVFFRKDDQFSNGALGLLQASDYSRYSDNGAIDLIRTNPSSGSLEWVENAHGGSIAGPFIDPFSKDPNGLYISGNLDLVTTMGSGNIFVGGEMTIDRNSLFTADPSWNSGTTKLTNSGELRLFRSFVSDPVVVPGDYQQFDSYPVGEVAGSLGYQLGQSGEITPFQVLGTASLSGGLLIYQWNPTTPVVPVDDPIGPILSTGSFAPGRDQFDVISVPIVDLMLGDGSTTQGTLLPVYNQGLGPLQEIVLQPVTLEELLFTQNSFSSQGTPNDAVLADVTGALDGSPDGEIDLIVAVPEIPVIAPNGAVVIFQGAQTVNGYEMISATLYTGALVDAPGSVEVGYFDADSIPDIAFASLGHNGLNNDVHFLHMDSSSPTPITVAPFPSFDISSTDTVTDLASDHFVILGEGSHDLLLGIQSNTGSGGVAQTIAFGGANWESCEVDVDDVDTVVPSRDNASTRGNALADVVITSPVSDVVTYFINTGDFDNMIPIVLPTGRHPTEVLAEDLNNDGENDLVIICSGTFANHGLVTIARNLGNDIFAAPVNIPIDSGGNVNPHPVSLALSDIDDDADLDIVLVSVNIAQEQRVRVLRNTSTTGGGLSFTSITDTPNQPGGVPLIVRSADLDGDSPTLADDIVVLVDPSANLTNEGSSLNSIDLSGSFCPADLNSDGLLDFFDISVFLSAFGAEDITADFNSDGAFDFFDISAFLIEFMNGCGS
jgi:hypothetical protein